MIYIYILGSGGFGREVYFWSLESLSSVDFIINGFIDKREEDLKKYKILLSCFQEKNFIFKNEDRFILGVGDPITKKNILENLSSYNLIFEQIIHPTTILAPTAQVGTGSIVCPFSVLPANSQIKEYVLINSFVSIGHDAVIDKYTTISPHVSIGGNASIGKCCFIGSNASIAPGVRVGDFSKISANSFVCEDVKPGSLAVGVPARCKEKYYNIDDFK